MTTSKNTTPRLLPISGETPEQIARAVAIRARTIPVIEGATQIHLDSIANTFPDANRRGRATMQEAARVAVAGIAREWLGQSAASWWIEHEEVSVFRVIEAAVKAEILAAAKR
jgi:chorismate-pyruvate lyase